MTPPLPDPTPYPDDPADRLPDLPAAQDPAGHAPAAATPDEAPAPALPDLPDAGAPTPEEPAFPHDPPAGSNAETRAEDLPAGTWPTRITEPAAADLPDVAAAASVDPFFPHDPATGSNVEDRYDAATPEQLAEMKAPRPPELPDLGGEGKEGPPDLPQDDGAGHERAPEYESGDEQPRGRAEEKAEGERGGDGWTGGEIVGQVVANVLTGVENLLRLSQYHGMPGAGQGMPVFRQLPWAGRGSRSREDEEDYAAASPGVDVTTLTGVRGAGGWGFGSRHLGNTMSDRLEPGRRRPLDDGRSP